MTITTRSKRVSPFAGGGSRHHATPAAVGPGAYSPEKTRTSFPSAETTERAGGGALTGSSAAVRPQFSGFATSEKRHLNENRTTSAFTPGPGAYSSSPSSASGISAPSNVFATKISRFAPSAPGSTVFRPSSIQDNPGPGSYDVACSGSNQSSHDAAAAAAGASALPQSALLAAHAAGRTPVPAIPKKEQSYGYVAGEDGVLRRQAPPAAVYSGVGADTVGPAAYNAHVGGFFDVRRNAAPSLRSSVEREVWADSLTPRREVPGPGAYNPHGAAADDAEEGAEAGAGRSERLPRRDRRRRQRAPPLSAVFASKVPLLPSPKPAARFDAERELELQAKEARARPRQDARRRRAQGSKVEAFGSTTGRVELAAQQDGPVVFAPTFLTTPGPGMYHGAPGGGGGGGLASLLLRRASCPAGRRRDVDGVGFSSASARACLAPPRRTLDNEVEGASRGPGAYRSETPRSLDHSVRARLAVGRLGVFGSTAPRDVWAALDPAAGGGPRQSASTPGPGAYHALQAEAAGGALGVAGAASAVFKSSSSRFASRASNPHVLRVGDCATPGVGAYDLLNARDATATSPHRRGEDSGAAAPTPAAAFLSMSERVVFDAREAADAPGPGAYESAASVLGMAVGAASHPTGATGLTRSRATRATLGTEERFRVKPTVPAEVGPGAYAIPGTVGTRSFNVTMAAKRLPQ